MRLPKFLYLLCRYQYEKKSKEWGKVEGDGVMRDKKPKLEEIEASLTLDGAGGKAVCKLRLKNE